MNTYRQVFGVISTILFFLVLSSDVNAQCEMKGTTVRDTKVYNRAPHFYTGSGWKLGDIVTTLPANTNVMICEKIEIGHLLNKKTWYRIQYNNNTGWVYSNDLRVSWNKDKRFRNAYLDFSFVSNAYAQSKESSGDNPLPSSTVSLVLLYLCMFILILSGMFAKLVFDEIDSLEELSIRNCLKMKKCIKAIIVAPLVFLAFLKTADFTSNAEIIGLIVIACIAFQNGFFWQTVLHTNLKKV